MLTPLDYEKALRIMSVATADKKRTMRFFPLDSALMTLDQFKVAKAPSTLSFSD